MSLKSACIAPYMYYMSLTSSAKLKALAASVLRAISCGFIASSYLNRMPVWRIALAELRLDMEIRGASWRGRVLPSPREGVAVHRRLAFLNNYPVAVSRHRCRGTSVIARVEQAHGEFPLYQGQ
ncbi:hypothetical protein NL676_030136 [Syzygium grande]|nr:hypothetical protein NL676_030136 [Syzygium grande]